MKAIIISLSVFMLAFIAVRHIDEGGIVLYQGILTGGVVAGGLWIFLRRGGKANSLQNFKDALLSFCLIYCFVFTVPTTVDRAYSVRMIDKIAEANDGLSESEIGATYADYFSHDGGLNKRIREQITTGTIKEEQGRFVITPMGRLLTVAFRLTASVFVTPL